ncbi:hypothetical protein DMN91_004494 [Ooceraea biroi]|uniref:Uncharacterized protein n=1 Tax=Ooceraea biroi TaxID=2015173 RepID=A0A3L8DVF7_OOCBI|nr:hypothetical protein DMN91_004494 [Ooceraea biroi]
MSKYLVVLLLSSSLTFIVGLSSKSQLESESGHAPYNRFTYHLPNDVVPLFYEIDLIVSLHNENLIVRGDSTIKIEVYNETKVISLHYVGYIRNVMIISEIGTPVSVPSKSYIKETETVDLHFENVISPGRYKLVIQYISKSLKSLFKIPYFTNTTESWFIYTVFQPYGARYVFPCWDEPAIEAAFAVKARYQTDDTTDPEAEDWDESKHQLSSFHSLETSKLHIYHVEITLYPSEICLDLRYVPKIKSVIWCREHMNPLFQVAYNTTRSVMKSLSEYTMSQKQLNLDYKVIPGIRKDSIGNWKILIYREGAISYDKDLDPIAQQMEITRLITRTIANLWFHSMVSPFRWKHFWLNEALAAFFQTKVLKDDMLELFLVQTLHESLYLDTNDGEINDNFEMIPLENYMSLEDTLRFSFTISLKAPAIFYMLEHMINPHVFREGLASYFVIHNPNIKIFAAPAIIRMLQYISSKDIYQFIKIIREYFKVHQLQTVTANDLWAIIDKDNSSKLRDHTNPTYNIPNLKKLMHTWIKEMHYPVLKVIRNYHNNMVMMLQENHNILDRNQWWIPVTYTTQTELEFTDILPKLWLQPGVQNLIIEETVQKNEWIIANLQQAAPVILYMLENIVTYDVFRVGIIRYLSEYIPGWKEWIYCNGLKTASRITWLKFFNIHAQSLKSVDNVLRILSCSGGVTSSNFQYNMQLSNNLTTREECINILYYVVATYEQNGLDTTLANLKDHILYCTFTPHDMIKVLTVIINRSYLEFQFSKVKEFVKNNINAISATIQHAIKVRQNYVKHYRTTFLVLSKGHI